MATFIKVKSEEHGELALAIQQYEVGLYVCASKSGRMIEQFGTSSTEKEFLEEIADIIIVE